MRYADGREALLGDKVALGNSGEGEIVCSIDTGEFSPLYPKAQWAYLKHGVLISFPEFGLIHYQQPEPELRFVQRAPSKVEK